MKIQILILHTFNHLFGTTNKIMIYYLMTLNFVLNSFLFTKCVYSHAEIGMQTMPLFFYPEASLGRQRTRLNCE